MKATRKAAAAVAAGAAAALAAGGGTAAAYPPDAVVEKTDVNIVRLPYDDNPVTEACGFGVTVRGTGTRTFVTWPNRTVGLIERVHSNVAVVAWSDYGEIRFRHTGQWRVVATEDGRLLLYESGQGPLMQKGRLVVDITQAEEIVIKEAATSIEEGIAQLCEELGP